MGILYKLTFSNGKRYIGITTESLARRVRRHVACARAGKPYALSAAIRKYGEDSFVAEVIGASDSWSGLVALEMEAVLQHRSLCPHGYNMTGGGEGSFRVAPSPEKRKKISESLSGRKLTEAHRAAVGLAQVGKTITAATRKKMSAAHKNRAPMSEEQRRIRSEAACRQQAARRALLAQRTEAGDQHRPPPQRA